MPDTNLPTSPTGSRFGWPKPRRLVEFAALLEQKELPTERVVFQGRPQDIPIIRVPIDLPKYRMANGRTASLQVEYLARNPKARADLFTGDPELWDAQEAQHGLLLQLSKQADLAKYFGDVANKQINPILLDENGFAVNGNRRLATWRQLLIDESDKYGHFAHIDVAVLPHCDEREIDRLEARLQIERDIRAEYNWDAQANMMMAKMAREEFKPAELAKLYGMKTHEVQELLDMRSYADEYLKSRGKADLWSVVSPNEFAFRRLVECRSKITGVAKQEMFKEAVFALIDNPSSVGRLYQAIPELAESLDDVSVRLNAEFSTGVEEPAGELEELFGGFGVSTTPETSVIKVLKQPESMDRAREVIADVLEGKRQLKRDTKAAGYLLDACAKANAALQSAVKDGLRAESKRAGVALQLDGIEAQVTKIREFLAKHAEG
jgi:hypothetical protein